LTGSFGKKCVKTTQQTVFDLYTSRGRHLLQGELTILRALASEDADRDAIRFLDRSPGTELMGQSQSSLLGTKVADEDQLRLGSCQFAGFRRFANLSFEAAS